MRAIALILAAAVCLAARDARAQDAYAGVLLQYFTGDGDAAVEKLRRLGYDEIQSGLDAFELTRNGHVLTGAAAMHTEAALGRDGGLVNSYHLNVAAAIVEFGEPHRAKTNTTITLRPLYAMPVSNDFRRIWYCTVITALEGGGLLKQTDAYLAHALALDPGNAEFLLLAGIAQEMHASLRTATPSRGDRRKALEGAEKFYRAVVAKEPGRLEARLRLARVLQQRDQLSEARTLLEPLTAAEDGRLAYLGGLFLGGVEDQLGHPDAAYARYQRAATGLPIAQAARLAASELRHRSGDRIAAAAAVPAAAGALNVFDPWWTYAFGEYWRTEILLKALRRARQG